MMQQFTCPNETFIKPFSIYILSGREVKMGLAYSPFMENTESQDYPKFISVTVMPCPWEPVLQHPPGRVSNSRAVTPKLGRLLVQMLKKRLGPRYSQMRTMSPVFVTCMDTARLQQSLTGALLKMLDLSIQLFRQITPFICQILRQGLAYPRGNAEGFFPKGSLYCCWLVGRLLLVPGENPNARELAGKLRKWVLGGDQPQYSFVKPSKELGVID
jgi:hypothetical protein